MIEVKVTEQQAKNMEEYVQDHIYHCHEELMGEDVPEDWSSFGPYCGCNTCESREYLMATFAWLKDKNILDLYVIDGEKDDSATLF